MQEEIRIHPESSTPGTEKNNFMRGWPNSFTLPRLSLQRRLPLWICLLLLSTVITFGLISYIGVKNAALKTGKERLVTLTGQLSSMFSQSAQAVLANTHTAAKQEPIVKYLQGDLGMEDQAKEAIKKLRPDSSWVMIELVGPAWQPLLHSSEGLMEPGANFDSLLQQSAHRDSAGVGRFYSMGKSIYYAVTVPIVDNKQVIGHLVRWKLQTASPKSLEQFSQLIGTKAKLYFGNADGSLWTDLAKPVPFQSADTGHFGQPLEYRDHEGMEVIAAAQPITHTPWIISISFPRQIILGTTKRFLQWIMLIGLILTAAGVFIGWRVSRNITKPLNKLTAAALAITGGDYTSLVEVDRNDELGTLATAFNSMAIQVRNAKEDLEKKVTDRTLQLEMANRELESFSYSISHDLRAPLRAIIGFTTILKEDYGGKLDEEASRITTIIKANTEKMGHLIDALLAFARLGRQDINKSHIDSGEMVKDVIKEQLQGNKPDNITWILQPLPAIRGDANVIRQVWVNLVSNAIKYSQYRDRPKIEIGSFDQDDQTVFFIKDNGVGFDEQYKDKLYKVFQRLHSAQEFEGTGIGLALVEKIISKHSGKVWAESVLNEGATFYFSLPKNETDEMCDLDQPPKVFKS